MGGRGAAHGERKGAAVPNVSIPALDEVIYLAPDETPSKRMIPTVSETPA